MRRLVLILSLCGVVGALAAAPAGAQTLAPTSGSFPATQVNKKSGPVTFTLTAGFPLLATDVAVTPSPTFSQTNDCPAALVSFTACTINVFFAPETEMPAEQTGTLFAGGMQASLTGTAVAAPPAKKGKCKKGKKKKKGKKGAEVAKKKCGKKKKKK